MNYKFYRVLFVLIFKVLILSAQNHSIEESDDLLSIRIDEIFNTISFLASDSLKGRSAGSVESDIAAKFIAQKFIQYKLKPIINFNDLSRINKAKKITEEDYYQSFTFFRTKLSENNLLQIEYLAANSKKIISFNYKEDFFIQANKIYNDLKIEAPIVFAGYGVVADELDYNDYLDSSNKIIEVRNKVVLIVDGFPGELDSNSVFYKSRNPVLRNPLRKAEIAKRLGALAVIIVSSPLKREEPFNIKFKSRIDAYSKSFYHLSNQKSESIPIIFASERFCSEIFNYVPESLNSIIEKIERNKKGNPFIIRDLLANIELKFDREIYSTNNVVGLIEGIDNNLKNEYILITAHYDHIGLGYYGASNRSDIGKIHNGADDNASGVSVLLELVEAFSLLKTKRSILFIAFSAEENGLLGSRYFVNHQPLIDPGNIVAMFNFDMVGRNDPRLLWIGGVFYCKELIDLIERFNKEKNFELLYNTGLLNFASDQAPFLRKGIPSAFFFSGIHEDYHTPQDDVEKINLDKISSVSKLAFETINFLANSDARLKFEEMPLEERKNLVEESLKRLKKYRFSNNSLKGEINED